MAITIQTQEQLPIMFRIGISLINDPAPNAPLKKKHDLLARQFPQVRFTNIFESDAVLENGAMVYNVLIPPPKVNG